MVTIISILRRVFEILAIIFLLLFLYAALRFFEDWRTGGELLFISLIGALLFGILATKLRE